VNKKHLVYGIAAGIAVAILIPIICLAPIHVAQALEESANIIDLTGNRLD
jgi:predicted small secreted protein